MYMAPWHDAKHALLLVSNPVANWVMTYIQPEARPDGG